MPLKRSPQISLHCPLSLYWSASLSPTQWQQLRLNYPSAVFLGLCHTRFMPTSKCIAFLFRSILPTLVIFGYLSITAHLCGRHWNCWTVLPPVCPASSVGWTSSESGMSKWEGKWSLELDTWGLELVGWWWGGTVSQSVLATRTEYHPLGGLSTMQSVISTVLEARNLRSGSQYGRGLARAIFRDAIELVKIFLQVKCYGKTRMKFWPIQCFSF